eukprot:CAMPEP_0184236666 /NCGR_PEP_ID=MMETSP0976-20121227/25948_1 /TAXON_ID=483370 /ORGANISM="non described non described, Strain CCMP2097" /LENGTH=279 /DNA_ID=CAMNT_0026541779 /DNA_START=118 /DNA_END=953 /DNA_ORIENTATION=+
MLMEVEGLDCAEYEYSPRNVHKQMRGVSAPRPRRTAGAPEPAFICGDLAACEFEPANDAGLHRRFADACPAASLFDHGMEPIPWGAWDPVCGPIRRLRYPALGYAYLRGYDIAIRADGRGAAAIAVASHGGVVSPRAAALGGARAAPPTTPPEPPSQVSTGAPSALPLDDFLQREDVRVGEKLCALSNKHGAAIYDAAVYERAGDAEWVPTALPPRFPFEETYPNLTRRLRAAPLDVVVSRARFAGAESLMDALRAIDAAELESGARTVNEPPPPPRAA